MSDLPGKPAASVSALAGFRAQVEKAGLWDGAWLALVVLRGERGWVLSAMKVMLTAPGVRVPPRSVAFDLATENATVRTGAIELGALWPMLEQLAHDDASGFTKLALMEFGLPKEKNSGAWVASSRATQRNDRVQYQLSRHWSAKLHDEFGYDFAERVDGQLRRHSPPYQGLKEVGANLGLQTGLQSHDDNLVFEVIAEFPLGPLDAKYSRERKGIEVRFDAGARVPIEKLVLSATPEPRVRLPGTEFLSSGKGETRNITCLIASPPLNREVELSLHFESELVGKVVVPSSKDEAEFAEFTGPARRTAKPGRTVREGTGVAAGTSTARAFAEDATPAAIRGVASADVPAAVDAFGFKPYVEALAGFLMNPKTKPPLTVAIEGEWGSGKSSFMLQLGDALDAEWARLRASKATTEARPKMVKFNAWRFDKDDALWASFAQEFARQVKPGLPPVAWALRARLGLARLAKGAGWLGVLKALVPMGGFAVASWFGWAWVSRWADEAKALAALLAVPLSIPVVKSLFDFFGNPFSVDLKKLEDAPSYEGRVPFLQQFHDDFALLVKHYVGPKRRAFVFVDDLDRCEVPRAAELLQAINLMIPEDSQLVFILGIDREKVAAGVAAKHEKLLPFVAPADPAGKGRTAYDAQDALEYGHNFIERFVQIPFRLPRISVSRMEPLLDHLLGKQPSLPRPALSPSATPAGSPSRQVVQTPTSGGLSVALGAVGFEFSVTQQPPEPTVADMAQRQEFLTNAEVDSPHVREVVRMAMPALGGNPRQLKRFVNLFRLTAYIAAKTGLLELTNRPGATKLTLVQLGKWVVLRMRWPRLLQELELGGEAISLLRPALSPGNEDGEGPLLGRAAELHAENPGLRDLLESGVNDAASAITHGLAHVDLSLLRDVAGVVEAVVGTPKPVERPAVIDPGPSYYPV